MLRVYDAERGGPPLYVVNVAEQLQLNQKKKGKKKHAAKKKRMKSPETDIEAATLLDGYAYWMTSHALTKNGERDPRRFRFLQPSCLRVKTSPACLARHTSHS